MENNNRPNIKIEKFHADERNINFGNVYDSNINIDNYYT